MSEDIEIGSRLRDARVKQNLSLRLVAAELGVSPSLISQVENGHVHPSVSTLYALVNLLGLSLDELFDMAPRLQAPWPETNGTDRPYPPPVQRAADNPHIEMEDGVTWERLAVGVDDGPADAFLVTYAPQATSSVEGKLMRHAGVEYGYLMEGELTLQLEFDTFVLSAGDSLHFDSVRPHRYINTSPHPAKGVWFHLGRREQPK
ncbi:MAG: helix-turn-helix domain-containing protein [Agromyces sp.]